jgi:glucoamylase
MKSPPDSYAAIVGDSKMLAVLSRSGEIVRLFWPHVDYGQHVEKFKIGVKPSSRKRTLWLDDSGWIHWQTYVESTNVLITESKHDRVGLNLTTTAFVLPGCDALALSYSVRNEGKTKREITLLVYEHIRIDESPYNNTALFDESAAALVFYLRDTAVATYSSRRPSGYQLGVEGEKSSALAAAQSAELDGTAIQHKSPDAAIAWDLGPVEPGESAGVTLFIALADSYREAISDAADFAATDTGSALHSTKMYWRTWIAGDTPEHGVACRDSAVEAPAPRRRRTSRLRRPIGLPPNTLAAFNRSHREKIARLFDRSLLAIKLLSDRETGAIIAAPEFDREREACGGYGYTWGRDGAFIAHSLGLAGFPNEAEAFFGYARRVQEPGGAWLHRHYSSGQLAPSWGLLQIDETGAILWAMAQHYRMTRSREFLRDCWESIERGAQYLTQSIDPETGLPIPSFDLWEEDICESIYAAAAVTAGLAAAAECAAAQGSKSDSRAWAKGAVELRQAIIQRLWDPKRKTFLRAVKKVVSEETFAKGWKRDKSNFYIAREDGRMYDTFFQSRDSRVDSSLLGLAYPFRIFSARDPMMRGTARSVHNRLWWKPTGGILRYEGDHYAGGNPWILTTLWLALYHAEAGETSRAARLIEWAADHGTETDLLTEQVDKKTGKPMWAVPLAWSHAMFLLATLRIGEKR